MSEPADLIPTLPTSTVQNTVGKGNEQTLENPNRPASDAALQEYCDKYYHQLLSIIAEKVHKEKTQQDKLKEVKSRLNFEECLGRNSKIQEVSQHSKCRTPNIKGEHEKGRRSRHSRSISRSLEPTSVFSSIRRNRSVSPKHKLGVKEEGKEVYLTGYEVKERVCSHTQKAVTKVPVQRKRNPFLKKCHHEGMYSRRKEVLFESEDSGGGH
ncbi:hypothetical protein Tco_1485367 [Tanacetum coccineum]